MTNYKDKDLLRQIWTATFGAVFAMDFLGIRERSGFDTAMEAITAEAAETVADKAVEEWIRWNDEGCSEKWKAPWGKRK